MHVVDLESGTEDVLVAPAADEPDEVSWGLAEFVASEELGRSRGFWWAPDSRALVIERHDESPVKVWYIAELALPDKKPRAARYPQAGTDNALVPSAVVRLDGTRVDVDWSSDRELDGHVLEYLVDVEWSVGSPVITS